MDYIVEINPIKIDLINIVPNRVDCISVNLLQGAKLNFFSMIAHMQVFMASSRQILHHFVEYVWI